MNYLSSSIEEVNLPLYRDIYKKDKKLPKLIQRQLKEASIQRGNCMHIPYQLLLQIIYLKAFSS